MTIVKKCIGCHSNKKRYGVTYDVCKLNLGRNGIHNRDHKRFRDQYCPCVECLVKSICTNPKINMLIYDGIETVNYDKCNLLKDQIVKFRKHIKRKNK